MLIELSDVANNYKLIKIASRAQQADNDNFVRTGNERAQIEIYFYLISRAVSEFGKRTVFYAVVGYLVVVITSDK